MDLGDAPQVPIRNRRASMKDVARLAGVGEKTVSRVVNGEPNVSDKTKARVLTAIAELDFRPNNAARALATNRSNSIGFLFYGGGYFGPSRILEEVENAARALNYSVVLSRSKSGQTKDVQKAIEWLISQDVDGILVYEPSDSPSLLAPELNNIPVVVFEGNDTSPGDRITLEGNGKLAASLAVEHLLALGHETVHHIAGPMTWSSASTRCKGWEQALRENQRTIPPPKTGDWSAQSGYLAGRALAEIPDMTSIFCANDEMAIGAMKALHEAGLSIPNDVSIIGMDGIAIGEYLLTPLTTVKQDFQTIAMNGVNTLINQIQGVTAKPLLTTPPTVKILTRGSTAAPRKQ